MKTVGKAVAAVLRTGETGREILVFQHPLAGVQLPKGTIEENEGTEAAALRELEEESGLALNCNPMIIGKWTRIVQDGRGQEDPLEINEWHVAILQTSADLPNRWVHGAKGSPAEEGLLFEFYWLPVDQDLPASLHPLFEDVARMIINHT